MVVKTLVTFIIRLVNLLEAEAKSAKRHIIRLGVSLALAWAAVALLLSAAGIFAAAVAVALSEVMHPGWALAVVGLIVLAIAGAMGVLAKVVFGKKRAQS